MHAPALQSDRCAAQGQPCGWQPSDVFCGGAYRDAAASILPTGLQRANRLARPGRRSTARPPRRWRANGHNMRSAKIGAAVWAAPECRSHSWSNRAHRQTTPRRPFLI
eukprot:12760462-Alexandrium_andersonii.AAC.1